MTKEKKELNSKMREIIRMLHKKGGAMSANEISEETGLAYLTVKKYLEDLLKKGVIVENDKEKQNKKI